MYYGVLGNIPDKELVKTLSNDIIRQTLLKKSVFVMNAFIFNKNN